MLRPQCDIFEHDPVLISTQSNMFSLSPDARSIETRSDGDSNNYNDIHTPSTQSNWHPSTLLPRFDPRRRAFGFRNAARSNVITDNPSKVEESRNRFFANKMADRGCPALKGQLHGLEVTLEQGGRVINYAKFRSLLFTP